MFQEICTWSWSTIWSAVSAIFTAATVGVAWWAMRIWRQQEALKAKMSLKMAVAEYSNALSQLPVNLASPQIRIEKRPELRDLRIKLNAVMNSFLVCEHMLERYPRVVSCCRSLPDTHKEYVRGRDNNMQAKYLCHLLLSQPFVFK
ncbi:hypothetical protein [Enterobacter hormaechei]|uniref:hypothetical protein n=1 Tax=Enterobacter hormaechei TaxID=158836 RepID=UPI0020236804|nr:hypothetical protein [Enterobacter hormaechei]MCL8354989.1 hypothetical protein [Enterobacter hormaechei subsp. xiangfangensis]